MTGSSEIRKPCGHLYPGELPDAFLYDDDTQIREAMYGEEPGQPRHRVSFWALGDDA